MSTLTTTYGITMLTLCFLAVFVYMPLVNWKLKSKVKQSKTVKNNFWTITKQEILDEFKFDKHGY